MNNKKKITKKLCIGQYQNSTVIDLPWGNCIPSKRYMMTVDMAAYSGSYDKNPVFLRRANLNGLSVSLNGRTVHTFSVSLLKQFAPPYNYTLKALEIDQHHLISYDEFTKATFIVVLDLAAENMKEAVGPEYTGILGKIYPFQKLQLTIKSYCSFAIRRL